MKSLNPYCISFFAIVALAVSPARADYHYASHEGSNEHPYISWETAALVIQDAVDTTDPQDTVYIGAGDWYQYVQTGVYDSIALIGMGIESTFCHYDSLHGSIFWIYHGCSVERITFLEADYGACIYAEVYSGVSINNCRFMDSHTGIAAAGYPTHITNCIFDNCARAIVDYVWIGDFFISNNLILNAYDYWAIKLQVYSAIVQNNIIINVPGEDVDGIVSGWIEGEVIIRNNVVIGGTGGIGVDAEKEYNNLVMNSGNGGMEGMTISYHDSLFNNSITGCGEALLVLDSGYFSYNNSWNNNEEPSFDRFIDPVGNISSDPMYISDDDFHLQAFSPLIDAGHPDYIDVDGSRSDMGAYGGPYGESYEYQDLQPEVPDSLTGYVDGDSIVLTWAYNSEADFSNYLLHRDTLSGFEPSIFNLISEPDTSNYVDGDILPGVDYYYRISALDNQGNESDYSEELAVIQTGIWDGVGVEPPRMTIIQSNYPNPFNSSTTIVYAVADLGPIPAEIEVTIYDIVGRKVRTLVHERRGLGIHRVIWDGRNDSGRDCPSGVYFARITQWGVDYLSKHRKLTLLR